MHSFSEPEGQNACEKFICFIAKFDKGDKTDKIEKTRYILKPAKMKASSGGYFVIKRIGLEYWLREIYKKREIGEKFCPILQKNDD